MTKLSPLALLPALAAHRRSRPGGGHPLAAFTIAFTLATALVFLPVLAHSTPALFLSRTLGFQATREPSESLWSALQLRFAAGAPWLATVARVAHGALLALSGTFAVLSFRVARRDDAVGLAAVCSAVLLTIEACLSYFSYSYILWFAPLVMIAVVIEGTPAGGDPASGRTRESERRLGSAPAPSVESRRRTVAAGL